MSTYKAAVIGLGKIGLLYDFEPQRAHPATHVFAYEENPHFDLVCAVDADAGRRDDLRRSSAEAAFFPSLEAAVEAHALDNVDVVSVCTPPQFHYGLLEQLMERKIGRVIFCEKPLVGSVSEAGLLRALAKDHPNVSVIPNISRRWNPGLRKVTQAIASGEYGALRKILVRYTRGIYNTGAHLFDLLRMWTGEPICRVSALSETGTTAEPEKSYSFFFEQKSGVTGYAEAVDDSSYYLFDIDLYLTNGKIEMRSSGDEVLYYQTRPHHLFEGFRELELIRHEKGLLADSCFRYAMENIHRVLQGTERPACTMEDAIYPLYVAEALEKSYQTKKTEEVLL